MSESLPFIEHFYELRKRLFKVAFALLVGAGIGYFLREKLLVALVEPLKQPLYYTTPGGGFDFVIKLCLFFGVVLATPVAIYQLFMFLQPVIDRKSTKFIRIGAFMSVILMALGVLFGYFITLPNALHFLHEFSNDSVRSLITTNEYFNFVMIYLAGFGLLFQLPIIVLFINRIKPLKPSKMLKSERWVVLVSFVAAGIITPTPDPMNQVMMAAPIILLYNLSLVLTVITNRGHKKAPVPVFAADPAPAAPVSTMPSILQSFQQQKTAKIHYAAPSTVSPRPRAVNIDGFNRVPQRNNLSANTQSLPTKQSVLTTQPAHAQQIPARPIQRLAFDVF